jgi:hypothetical protein
VRAPKRCNKQQRRHAERHTVFRPLKLAQKISIIEQGERIVAGTIALQTVPALFDLGDAHRKA